MTDVNAQPVLMALYFIPLRFTGNRVIVCATKEILAGEEVNNCYGESAECVSDPCERWLASLHNFRVDA